MPTTITGDLHGLDTEDKSQELSREARRYDYTVTATGGKVKVKIENFTGDLIGPGAEFQRGKWRTLVPKFDTDAGQTTNGHFTLPKLATSDTMGLMRVQFSRAIGTSGVNYEFHMEP